MRPWSHVGLVDLFENQFGLNVVTTRREYYGGGQNECAACPGKWTKSLAEKLHAQDRSERRFDVEKDAGARGRDMMDAGALEKE